MKNKIACILALVFLFSILHGQTVPAALDGKWIGKLKVGIELRIVFNFEVDGDSIYTVLDSPDQGVNGIPTAHTTYNNGAIVVDIPLIKGKYSGHLNAAENTITGTWNQGAELPLDLAKTDSVTGPARPQNPVEPYPYRSEEIVFQNKKADSVFLAGTITIPDGKGPFPSVILVTGSGQQNRDEFLMGHSPFLVLSDYLTRHGIIVLRYDDRGFGASTGDATNATSADFAWDAIAAAEYLRSRKDLPVSRIGIAGHSEGGMIAPMAASKNKHVDFIVLMAGPGIPGDSLLSLQGKMLAKANGADEKTIALYASLQQQMIQACKTATDPVALEADLIRINKEFIAGHSENELESLGIQPSDTLSGISFFSSRWMQYFLNYDPYPVLSKTKIPVLAINGTTDLQVPYKENLHAIEGALRDAGNDNFRIVELPGLNHLFQTSKTGSPSEYGMLEETFNENAMQVIAGWINGLK